MKRHTRVWPENASPAGKNDWALRHLQAELSSSESALRAILAGAEERPRPSDDPGEDDILDGLVPAPLITLGEGGRVLLDEG